MFEAQVAQGALWKKVVEAIKELVGEANFQTDTDGIGIQAMDSAHVALVSLTLQGNGFSVFECSRPGNLGINLTSLSKILKTTDNGDVITLRHADADVLTVVAESPDRSKQSEYALKLMEIESETMSIPNLEYGTKVGFGSADFAKVCKDMAIFGETVTVSVQHDGVKFSAASDFAEGFIFLRAGSSADAVKPEVVKRESGVKSERGVKKEATEDSAPAVSKAAGAKEGGAKDSAEPVTIEMEEPVTLSFALRYFTIFSKAASLSSRVELKLTADAPCMLEFVIEGFGHLRYYLAPKVEEE